MIRSPKLVARYRELKTEAPDCLLLMQVGAFMQVMNDDARAVSAVTELKLQMAGDEKQHPEQRPLRQTGTGSVNSVRDRSQRPRQ